MLGVADAELLFAALDAIADHDPGEALRVAARLSESGRDPALFFGDLESHARELLVVQTLGDVPRELCVTPDRDERLLAQAERLGPRRRRPAARPARRRPRGDERTALEARTQLELALVKAAAPDVDASTRRRGSGWTRLERQLAGGDGRGRWSRRLRPGPAASCRRPARPRPPRRPRPPWRWPSQPAGELGRASSSCGRRSWRRSASENDLLAAALERGSPSRAGEARRRRVPASAVFLTSARPRARIAAPR